MFQFLLKQTSSTINYAVSLNTLTISGSGEITENGVHSVGSYTDLERVIIEEGPSIIGRRSFALCEKLNYIHISKSITVINDIPFRICSRLITIDVDLESNSFRNDPQGILYSFDYKTIYRFPMKNSFVVPQGVEEILSDAFSNNLKHNFGTLTLPKSINQLHSNTFDSGCFESISFESVSELATFIGFTYAKVGTLTIPNSVTSIASDALYNGDIGTLIFEEGSKLTQVNTNSFEMCLVKVIDLPESVETIYGYAFRDSSITTIKIGSKCSSIDTTAFSGCKKLSVIEMKGNNNPYYSSSEGVLMNNDMTQIIFISGDLTTVIIQPSVTDIAQSSLQKAQKLKAIDLNGNTKWSTQGGVLYSNDNTHLIAVCGGITEINVNDQVTTIDDYAACGCSLLTTIKFSQSAVISTIGSNSFESSGITSFTLPNSVTTINKEAFKDTKSLTNFAPESKEGSLLQRIEDNCFYGSAIKSFYFGKDVTYVGLAAYIQCTQLSDISFHDNIQLSSFSEISLKQTGIIQVNLPSSLTSVSKHCFTQCKQLQKVTFKDASSLTSIEDYAFTECCNLTTVILPGGCKKVGIHSFSKCTLLSSFTHELTTIGASAFYGCTSLESFTFSSTQTKPDPEIFKGCSSLIAFLMPQSNEVLSVSNGILFNSDTTELIIFPPGKEMATIPAITKSFSNNAFSWSPRLKYVVFDIGSDLDSIGDSAFYECSLLKEVQFPPKLERIGKESFSGCVSIKSITLPNSLNFVGTGAFKKCNIKTVKYCGYNSVNGTDVFESTVKVSVTDLYKSDTFCSVKAEKKLSVDCEFKEQLIKTCRYSLFPSSRFLNHFLILAFTSI